MSTSPTKKTPAKKPALTLVGGGKAKPKGRPKFAPDLAKVEQLASQGLTNEQIAHALGISPATLYSHKSKFLEFSEAITRGAAKGVATVTNALYNKAQTGDTTACMFYLKARGGWSDKISTAEPQHHLGKHWVEKIESEQAISKSIADQEIRVQIGKQTAAAAREVLRLLTMTEEELLEVKAEMDAEEAATKAANKSLSH